MRVIVALFLMFGAAVGIVFGNENVHSDNPWTVAFGLFLWGTAVLSLGGSCKIFFDEF